MRDQSGCLVPGHHDCHGPGGSPGLCENRVKLNDGDQRFLCQSVDRMLPEAFQSLVSNSERCKLLEVACSPDSVLTAMMHEITKTESSAVRCSLWNGCDLSTGKGVRMVLDQIDLHDPEHVWISPICGPFSVMQNINQRTDQQCSELAAKRQDALRQYVGSAIIYRYCFQRGTDVTWEWSQSCQAWRLPLIQKLQKECQPWMSVIRGCQVNLRNQHEEFISKGWKIMTTNELLGKRMDLPCRCPQATKHVPCEGSLTSKTAFYTKEFAKRVCQSILHGLDQATLAWELQHGRPRIEGFGWGTHCACSEGKAHQANITCGHCTQGFVKQHLHDPAPSEHRHEEGMVSHKQRVKQESTKVKGVDLEIEEVRRKLYLLHAATGHGPIKHLVNALKLKKAPQKVIEEAERFTCSVCQERSRPQPRNQSSLEIQPRKFTVVSGDVGHWVHPTGEHYQFALFVDEGSRFRVARHVLTGKKKHVNAAQFISTFKESWMEYFGVPHTLKLDPDGAFRSHEMSQFCDQQMIYLDMIPGEAHWKLGTCERSIQSTKEVMSKLARDNPDLSFPDLMSETIRVFNSREYVRGYSPIQHVMGRAPDETGRFFPGPNQVSEDLACENPRHETQESHQLRLQAEQRFLEWNSQQRLSRAQNSKAHRYLKYHPGDLVFIWRKQLPGKEAKQRPGSGKFIGPARILATENKYEVDGSLKAGCSIWLVRGRRLLKCSVEQLRHASPQEKLLEELHTPEVQPWDFPRVAKELGGNDYDDVTEEAPTITEWRRAADPSQEEQPLLKRLRTKTSPEVTPSPIKAEPEVKTEATSSSSGHQPVRHRSRSRGLEDALDRSMEVGFQQGDHWSEQVHQSFFLETDQPQTFWEQPTAMVSVEIDMPQTRTSSERALKNLTAYMANAMKRKTIEVSEKYLTPEEKQQFQSAKAIEVNNFLAAKAFESLPEHLRSDKTKAIRMRWILTWKTKDDGSKKAKARAVLLGYQDPQYEHRSTTSPTTTRQTRQMQLLLSASKGFKTRKGDVTGAFLQSRPYPTDLLCIPCKEICEAMGIPEESVTKVKKACYGLVDAPLEWYRSISQFFRSIGLRKLWSDPCSWILEVDGVVHGIISGHVDDFLFSGSDENPLWASTCAAIKQEFKWTDWEEGTFTQCGVLVETHEDGSYSLSQEKYIDDLKYINLRSQRRKETSAETDHWEKSQLRTLLGGLSWAAQQTSPHLSAEVGLLLSEVNHSTVDTILRCNKLLDQAKARKAHRLRIHKMPFDDIILCAWCDAAAHNRLDGSSTQGVVIGAAPKELLTGENVPVSFMLWQSTKIQRVCRSPGASEAAAAVNAEDLLFFARFQLSEMQGNSVKIRSVNSTVNKIVGCLVSDSRNVYDKLATEVVVPKGAERRVDLEIMGLKASQCKNQLIVRWVNSEAQLANPLTKGKELKEMMLYYEMKQHWCIVEDESMSSARKRRQKGQLPLEHGSGSVHTTHKVLKSWDGCLVCLSVVAENTIWVLRGLGPMQVE